VGRSKSDPGPEYSSAQHVASQARAAHWDATAKRQAVDRRSAIASSSADAASRTSAKDDCPRHQNWTAAAKRWRVTAAASGRQAARRGAISRDPFAENGHLSPRD